MFFSFKTFRLPEAHCYAFVYSASEIKEVLLKENEFRWFWIPGLSQEREIFLVVWTLIRDKTRLHRPNINLLLTNVVWSLLRNSYLPQIICCMFWFIVDWAFPNAIKYINKINKYIHKIMAVAYNFFDVTKTRTLLKIISNHWLL